MPELPEVETIRLQLSKHILNKEITDVIVRQKKLRWEIPKNLTAKLLKQKFQKITRRGKYLIFQFANTEYLIIHLGMSGKLILNLESLSSRETLKHEHVTIIFADKTILSYVDPRKFGAILLTQNDPLQHPLLKPLGLEPFAKEFTAEYLCNFSRNKKINVKQFLMNSKIVVGIGNIYSNEILFLARIHPKRQAKDLTQDDCKKLAKIIPEVLKNAIKYGGTTIRDFASSHGSTGNFQQHLEVYGRGGLPCKNCGTKLTEIRLSGRTTVFCKNCQK